MACRRNKISKQHPIHEVSGTGGNAFASPGVCGHVDTRQHLWVQTISPPSLRAGCKVKVDVELKHWR